MVVCSSILRTTNGKLYYNHFDSSDDTTKHGSGSWSLETANSWLKWTSASGRGLAYYNTGQVNCVNEVRGKVSDVNVVIVKASVRATDSNNDYEGGELGYGPYIPLSIVKRVGGSGTSLKDSDYLNWFNNTWYVCLFKISGNNKTARRDGANEITESSDSTHTTQTLQGVNILANTTGQYGYIDYIKVYRSETLTMNNLVDGQKFRIRNGALTVVATSGVASGGQATINISSVATRPPYYDIQVLDTDGTTVIYTDTTYQNDVWGGDIYSQIQLYPKVHGSSIVTKVGGIII